MRFLLLLLLVPFHLLAEWESLFSTDEDPALFHHVHVISGQLNIAIEDTKLLGAYPFSLTRTYCSSAGSHPDNLTLQRLKRDCFSQEGWQLLPHTKLLVQFNPEKHDFKAMKFQVPEPSGDALLYQYSHKEKIKDHVYYYYYKPEKKAGKYAGALSGKNTPHNNVLRVYMDDRGPENFDLSIFLPNGGERHYEKLSKRFEQYLGSCYYKLVWETLPSKLKLIYTYEKDQLTLIDVKNPSNNKTLSWIRFELLKKDSPYQFKISTSDNHSVMYTNTESQDRQYLKEVQKDSERQEVFGYSRGEKEIGSRVSEMRIDNQIQVKVRYYSSTKPLKERDEKFYRKHPYVDKVQKLEAPLGAHGEMQTLAEFFYEIGKTDVRDAEGALTRYHHKEGQLSQIEYFHKEGTLHSVLKFIWENQHLKAKVLCDGEERPVFSKTFFYDNKENVIEEVLWGQITGQVNGSFALNSDGTLSGADHIHKWYEYDSYSNLEKEVEDGGMYYLYNYKEGTDLLTRKLSFHGGQILQREFYLYNDDHFLAGEILDDGNKEDLTDLTGVSQRTIKLYKYNDKGFIIEAKHLYLDLASHTERLIERHVYEYDYHNRLCQDKLYDGHDEYQYTLETEYDERDHIISQSNPLGQKTSIVTTTRGSSRNRKK